MAAFTKYLDPVGGNDGDSGDTPGAAWQTPQGVSDQVAADTDVIFMNTGPAIISSTWTLNGPVTPPARQTPVRFLPGDALGNFDLTQRPEIRVAPGSAIAGNMIDATPSFPFLWFVGTHLNANNEVTGNLMDASGSGEGQGFQLQYCELQGAPGAGVVIRGNTGGEGMVAACHLHDLGIGVRPENPTASRWSNMRIHGNYFEAITNAAVDNFQQQFLDFNGNAVVNCGQGVINSASATSESNVSMTNNVFLNMTNGDCVDLSNSDAVVDMFDNIFHTADNGYCLRLGAKATNAGFISNNAYYNPAAGGLGLSDVALQGVGNVTADPQLMDITPGSENLLLRATSPAINSAINGGALGFGIDPSEIGGGGGGAQVITRRTTRFLNLDALRRS